MYGGDRAALPRRRRQRLRPVAQRDLLTEPALLAEVVRNGFVEGRHYGSLVALDAGGGVALALGRPEAPMLPRSCAKPVQAVGMLRAGLAVDDDELAVVCASHNGDARQVAIVRRILDRVGLDEDALDNTPGMPSDSGVRRDMVRAGRGPSRIAQNCSGKHAGMLATCVAAGWPTEGYREATHPLQQQLRATAEELAGEPSPATVVDGCGAALFAVSLIGLTRSFRRLATAPAGSAERRCFEAMVAHPDLVGGSGRDVTTLMRAVPDLMAKDGAEGAYAAALADGRAVAVKVDDGAGRARLPALVRALREIGVDGDGLAELATAPVLGHGVPVGEIRAAF